MRLSAAALVVFASLLRAAVPTPASHFGHPIGADRKLLDWDQVVSYFYDLAKSSDSILVKEIGKTAEGRPMIAATISAPENLRRIDRYLEIQRRLADPRRTPPAEAEKLFAEGKAVVLVTCSIHATEVASTHTAVEFAYRLLTDEKPRFRRILQDTIFLLVPSLDPDGVDIVTRWYRKTLGTAYEGTSPPELYQKYTGHDDNRDWYIFSQPETRAVISQLHNVWHPQIVYDVHQMGANAARMFVPPWLDPIDPNIDAIIAQECNEIGSSMAADLTGAGKTGVAINAMYDFWSPSRHFQAYHGGLRILSESASAALASPVSISPEEIAAKAPGYDPRHRSWNYLEPWTGGEWRLRDIIDYQLIAMESCLYQAAIHREELLRNFYRIGERAVARVSPYAFIVPATQYDPGSSRKMLETLSFGQVEIEKAAAPFVAGGKRYSAGDYVIPMRQPYSSWAKTLLERQHYPDLRAYPGGPPKKPYDVTAQTLPLLMGVQTDTIREPFSAQFAPVTQFPMRLTASLPAGALAASDIDSFRAINRAWDAGQHVYRDTATGDFFLQPRPGGGTVEISRPRVGLYKSFIPVMDEGWTRWLLEQFGFAYKSPRNPEIQAGNLRARYDVIAIPDQPEATLVTGYRLGSMPREYTGGLGEKGRAALRQFVDDGGTLVFLDHSTAYAVDQLGVKVNNVVRGVPDRDFYCPGSLLNVVLDTHSPLTYGLPAAVTLWSENSPAWDVNDRAAKVVARYPASGVLASGWLLGERYLAGKAAMVDAPMGRGHLILFGMRPQYRAQSYQNFKLFFNALLYGAEK